MPVKPSGGRTGLTAGQKARIKAARATIAPEALRAVRSKVGGGTLRQRIAASARTLPTNQAARLKREAAKYYAPRKKR
jgi:hypothetical protein